MELSAEEEKLILSRREVEQNRKEYMPSGLGVAREYAKARARKKRFIEPYVYVEKEGSI